MNGKMLIVDDDAPVLAYLADIGTSCGYEVHTFDSGVGLVSRILETRPDFVVLDLVIPDLDGIEVLRELAAAGVQARILLISGFDPELLNGARTLARAWKLNITGTLAKPLDRDAVVKCMLDGAAEPLIQDKWRQDSPKK